jgi:SAM-dependent methyltransferase
MQNQTTTPPLTMPAAVNDGVRVPTLNGFGWMVTSVETYEPTGEFVKTAAASPHWALDIGCAYGAHALPALKAGARVVANDLDERHLQIFWDQTPVELRANLKTVAGAFPDVELPVSQFGAILAMRVLHFFDGPTLQKAARKISELLVPGGKVFVRVLAPYTKIYGTFIPEYERRKAAGEAWPGFAPDASKWVTDDLERMAMANNPIHVFEPEYLAKPFTDAGLIIEKCEYCPINLPWVHIDGRESTLLIARK